MRRTLSPVTAVERWRLLAQQLDGTYSPEEWSGEPLDVVYGEVNGFVYTALMPISGSLILRFDFPQGQDKFALGHALVQELALSSAVRQAHGCDLRLAKVEVEDRLLLIEWQPAQGRPDVDRLAPVVKALGHLLAQQILENPTHCTVCAAPQAGVHCWESTTSRLCAPCFEVKKAEVEGLRALELERETAHDDDADEEPFPLPEDLSPYRLDQMSQRFKLEFERSPKLARLKLLAFVALGQAVLSAGVVALLSLVGLFLGACLVALASGPDGLTTLAQLLLYGGIPFALVAGTAVSALSVLARNARRRLMASRAKEQEGERLDRQAAPRLFAWLEEIARELGTRVPDVVVLTSGTEAGIGERRVGWRRYESVLRLGVMVIEAFEQEELKAIVAHELGHLHHGDSRKLWIFRTADTWLRLARELGTEHGDSYLERFAHWYLPRFLVRARVAARHYEYRADRQAANLCGAKQCAQSLTKTVLLDEIFPLALWSAVRRHAQSPETEAPDSLALFRRGLSNISSARRIRLLSKVLGQAPSWYDTHPSVAERLRALGVSAPSADSLGFEPQKGGLPELIDGYAGRRERLLSRLNRACELRVGVLRRSVLGQQRRMQEDQPSTPAGWVRRARDQQELGLEAQALQALETALSLDPANSVAAKARLELWQELDRIEEASAGWEALMESNPGDVPTIYEAAAFYRECAMLQEEATCLRRLLGLHPPEEVRLELEYRLSRLELPDTLLGPAA